MVELAVDDDWPCELFFQLLEKPLRPCILSGIRRRPTEDALPVRWSRRMKNTSQKTPKGYEIPIPKRGDVLNVFKKAAQPLPRKSGPKK
jgi:hypothetical protein